MNQLIMLEISTGQGELMFWGCRVLTCVTHSTGKSVIPREHVM